MVHLLLVIAAGLVLLAGCASPAGLGGAAGEGTAIETTGAVAPATGSPAPADAGEDDLSLGKRHFRASNYGLAEQHFRRAVETNPRDGEAWIGLAAAYDRLRRFDLADRAYRQAEALLGPTAEVLNNQGFSYLLRGDLRRARATLARAQALDPENPYIANNLRLLAQSETGRKGLR